MSIARLLRVVACATAAVLFGASAQAVPLSDVYFGGDRNQDVWGSSFFNISGANVTLGGDTLTVVISTNYQAGTAAALGTQYGALFLSNAWSPTAGGASAANNYLGDTFQPNDWLYAIVMDNQTGATTSGNAAVYQVVNGQVVTSFVPPGGGSIRNGVAVQYAPGSQTSFGGVSASWSEVPGTPGTITFVINGYSQLLGLTSSGVALSWAMTCANDVIQGYVAFPPGGNTPGVPIPAGLPLLATAIAGLAGRKQLLRLFNRSA